MTRRDAVCVDTSSVVAYLLGDARLQVLFNSHWLCLPSVALGELYFGAFRSRDQLKGLQEVDNLLRLCDVLYPTTETARLYGELKADLASRGAVIPDNDIWIAATALEHSLPLATRDQHFDRIPTLPVLRW